VPSIAANSGRIDGMSFTARALATRLVPPDQWRAVSTRFAIVFVISVVIGLLNWVMYPSDAPRARRLDVSLVYAVAISLLTWAFVDVGRFVLRGPLRAEAPGYWPKPLRAAVLLALGIGAGYIGGTLIGDAYAGHSTWELLRLNPNRFTGILVSSIAISFAFVGYFYQRGRGETLARQAREAELRLLQSQLEPHMLFNTLANLRVLIGLDAARAQAMLDHLIAFLRATLSASRAGTHALADEFARLDDYLALMAVRMGPRLMVTMTLPPELAQRPVPALLLQPLVENSIQHGLEPKVEGGRIDITAQREGDRLVLTVHDSGIGLPAQPRPDGFGVLQVRQRLATRYGGRAALALTAAAGGGTLARIELPWETA
jgi:signal transduction histidine kinase